MKDKNSNRTRIIGLRLSTNEYARLEKKWKATTCRKLSDFIRKSLFHKPIVTTYRDTSLDDFMIETIQLKTELNAIGNNFNQAVKKLHTLHQIPEFKDWIIHSNVQQKILLNKVEEIKKHIQKITEKWLQS